MSPGLQMSLQMQNSQTHLDLQDEVIMLTVTDKESSCDSTGQTLMRKSCMMLTPGLIKYNSVKWQACVGTGGKLVPDAGFCSVVGKQGTQGLDLEEKLP